MTLPRLIEIEEAEQLLAIDVDGLADHVAAGRLHPVRRPGKEAVFPQAEVTRLVHEIAVEAGAVPELPLSATARIGSQLDQLRQTVVTLIGSVAEGADPMAALITIAELWDEVEDTVRNAGWAA